MALNLKSKVGLIKKLMSSIMNCSIYNCSSHSRCQKNVYPPPPPILISKARDDKFAEIKMAKKKVTVWAMVICDNSGLCQNGARWPTACKEVECLSQHFNWDYFRSTTATLTPKMRGPIWTVVSRVRGLKSWFSCFREWHHFSPQFSGFCFGTHGWWCSGTGVARLVVRRTKPSGF